MTFDELKEFNHTQIVKIYNTWVDSAGRGFYIFNVQSFCEEYKLDASNKGIILLFEHIASKADNWLTNEYFVVTQGELYFITDNVEDILKEIKESGGQHFYNWLEKQKDKDINNIIT